MKGFLSQKEKGKLITPIVFEKAKNPAMMSARHNEQKLIRPIYFVDRASPENETDDEESTTVSALEIAVPQETFLQNSFDRAAISCYGPCIAAEKKLMNPIKAESRISVPVKMTPYQIAQKLLEKEKFCTVGEALYFFDGRIYVLLTETPALRLIMAICRESVQEHGTPKVVGQVLEFLQIEPRLAIQPKEAVDWIAFPNGYLNVNTLRFIPPTPDLFLTNFLNFNLCLTAKECKNFDNFVTTISGGDPVLSDRIWEAIGYFVSSDMAAKVFLLLQGVPDSGKSVLGAFLLSLFNNEATATIDMFRMGDRFSLSGLVGKRINASLDLPSGVLNRRAISIIKQLTGGDLLTAEAKYQNAFTFRNSCKLVFATNHRLQLSQPDDAFEKRILLIPFKYQIPKEAQNVNLQKSFEMEKSAIILKSLCYYQKLVAKNYQFSGNFTFVNVQPSAIMPNDRDTVLAFINACCEFTDLTHRTFSFLLLEAYKRFCASQGVYPIDNQTQFSLMLLAICGSRIQKDKWRDAAICAHPMHGYRGIILK